MQFPRSFPLIELEYRRQPMPTLKSGNLVLCIDMRAAIVLALLAAGTWAQSPVLHAFSGTPAAASGRPTRNPFLDMDAPPTTSEVPSSAVAVLPPRPRRLLQADNVGSPAAATPSGTDDLQR